MVYLQIIMQKKKKKLCPGFTELFIDGILQILIKELFAQELLCKSRIFGSAHLQ